jgi:hypothetical protein
MPPWAEVIVAISDSIRAALPALVTLLAAWLAWIAIHRVSRINAKRDAYARYVGAAEIYANDYRRWMEARRAGKHMAGTVEPVKAKPVNEPLGAILLAAPHDIAALVHESQEALANLSAAAHFGDEWDSALERWREVRNRLINKMRADSGSDPLPAAFFGEK